MIIPLTDQQRDALLHRLEVPDAMCEALSDEENADAGLEPLDEEGFHPESVVKGVIECFMSSFTAEGLDLFKADARYGPRAVNAVLRDCVEGSTWACCWLDDTPRGERRFHKALDVLQALALVLTKTRGIKNIRVPAC